MVVAKSRLLVAGVLAVGGAVVGPGVSAQAVALPPGVVQLRDSEVCPMNSLCLYRDYGRRGPAYAVGAGYSVSLKDLPVGAGTAANNVSSWVNNTNSMAVLVDEQAAQARGLGAHVSLEEPAASNDTVDLIQWAV
ncbi:hypothetical protein GCM10022254_61370 [Actinomadura meridiana]|uniref:Peptidase inhibitor family I36 n=2 Tax=Actinomadura meridiana TaxID=559626 RepID=A0ABP8CIM3_9ACTN